MMMIPDLTSTADAMDQDLRDERRVILLETTREALRRDDLETLCLILNDQHPADLAEVIRVLGDEDQQKTIELLGESLAAGVLGELDLESMLRAANGLEEEQLSDIVEEMAPDDAADVLAELSEETSARVLDLMEGDEVDHVRELMAHAEDTGGGIMTSRLVAVGEHVTVGEATELLRAVSVTEEILAVYVVDAEQHLIGVASLRSMLLATGSTLMGSLADSEAMRVRPEMDQEQIAALFADYDLVVLPVVDASGMLVGQVTIDDIVDVIREEATEDIVTMAATSSEEMEVRSVFGVIRHRIPWLLLCLCGTLLSGGVIDYFDGLLAATGTLILFIPAIMAMGGNSGIQTSTVTVRSLATGRLRSGEISQALWRELRVAVVMALFLGLLVFGVAWLWTGGSPVAICVGLAMFAAVVLSALLGAAIPLLFRAVSIDPAVASGPLITTLNDVLSLLIYFGIALVLFNWIT